MYDVAVGGDDLHRAFEAENQLSLTGNLDAPLRWRVRGHAARRYNLKRFPYDISYVVRENVLWIVDQLLVIDFWYSY